MSINHHKTNTGRGEINLPRPEILTPPVGGCGEKQCKGVGGGGTRQLAKFSRHVVIDEGFLRSLLRLFEGKKCRLEGQRDRAS